MAGCLLTARRDPGHARSPPPRASSSGARPRAHIVSALRPLKRRRGRRGSLFQPRPDRRSSGGAGGPPQRNYFLSLRRTTSRRRWRRARHGGGGGGGAPEVERRRPGQASARPTRFAHPLPPRLRARPWRSPRPPDARCPSSSRVRRAARGYPRPGRGPLPAAAPAPDPIPRLPAELYFLIARYLSAGPCRRAAQVSAGPRAAAALRRSRPRRRLGSREEGAWRTGVRPPPP